MKATANELQFRWFTAAAIVLTGFIAYTNTFSNEFVWDDASSIRLHKHVQDPAKIGQLFRGDLHAFGRGQGNFSRPLLAVSFMADYAWAFDGKTEAGVPQPAVFPFHLTSTILHVGAALWLLALLCRMRAPRSVFLAVPLLWVVHPLHTEAVAYISGRGDSMAAFFMFAALWFGLWEGSPRKRVAGMILSGLFFVAAVLSKESALVLPFLYLPLLVWAPRADGTKPAKSDRIGRLPPIGIMTAILIVDAFLRTTVLNFGSDSAAPAAGLTARLLETGQAVAMYTKLIFVPTGLHPVLWSYCGYGNGLSIFRRHQESDLSTDFLLVFRTISLYILSCINYRFIPVEDILPDALLALGLFLLSIFARLDHYGCDLIPGSGGRQIGGLVHLVFNSISPDTIPVAYSPIQAHETPEHLVCRLLLEKKKNRRNI